MGWWEDFLGIETETGEKRKDVIDGIGTAEAVDFQIGAPVAPGLNHVKVPSPVEAATPATPAKPPDQETPNSQREYDPRGRVNPPPMPHMGRRVGPPLPTEVITNVLSALQPIFVNAERFIREMPERLVTHGAYLYNASAGAGYQIGRVYPADDVIQNNTLLVRLSVAGYGSATIPFGIFHVKSRSGMAAINTFAAATAGPTFTTPIFTNLQSSDMQNLIFARYLSDDTHIHHDIMPCCGLPAGEILAIEVQHGGQGQTFHLLLGLTLLQLT